MNGRCDEVADVCTSEAEAEDDARTGGAEEKVFFGKSQEVGNFVFGRAPSGFIAKTDDLPGKTSTSGEEGYEAVVPIVFTDGLVVVVDIVDAKDIE